MRRKQILIGLIALVIGALFYLVSRPAGSTYFIPVEISALITQYPLGGITHALPSFIHAFAFVMLTLGVIACRHRLCTINVTLTWVVIEVVFELAQHEAIAGALIPCIPAWFSRVVVLENIPAYLHHGQFALGDIVGVIAGAAAAALMSIIITGRRH